MTFLFSFPVLFLFFAYLIPSGDTIANRRTPTITATIKARSRKGRIWMTSVLERLLLRPHLSIDQLCGVVFGGVNEWRNQQVWIGGFRQRGYFRLGSFRCPGFLYLVLRNLTSGSDTPLSLDRFLSLSRFYEALFFSLCIL